jgi:hypothetical protein
MNERFTKVYDELIGLGLHPRLALLYGKLAFHAGADGKCHPKHSTLAQEVGLKPRQVRNLLDQLHELRLLEWTRSGGPNDYRVLELDRQWIAYRIGNGVPIGDRQRSAYTKEQHRKRTSKRSAASSSSFGLNNNNNGQRGFSADADVVVDGSPDRTPLRKRGALPKGWSREQVERLQDAIGATLTRGGVDRVALTPQAAIQLIRKSGGATEAEIHEVLRYHAERTSFRRADNPVGMLVHLVGQAFAYREGK